MLRFIYDVASLAALIKVRRRREHAERPAGAGAGRPKEGREEGLPRVHRREALPRPEAALREDARRKVRHLQRVRRHGALRAPDVRQGEDGERGGEGREAGPVRPRAGLRPLQDQGLGLRGEAGRRAEARVRSWPRGSTRRRSGGSSRWRRRLTSGSGWPTSSDSAPSRDEREVLPLGRVRRRIQHRSPTGWTRR